MKKAVLVVLELVVFLIFFVLGSVVLPGAGILPVLSVSAGSGRIFVYDGLLLMLAFYALFLLVATIRKRISFTWPMHTLAFVLALIFGLIGKFGFKSM